MAPDLLSGLWAFFFWFGFGTLMSPGAGAFAGWLTTGFTHRVAQASRADCCPVSWYGAALSLFGGSGGFPVQSAAYGPAYGAARVAGRRRGHPPERPVPANGADASGAALTADANGARVAGVPARSGGDAVPAGDGQQPAAELLGRSRLRGGGAPDVRREDATPAGRWRGASLTGSSR